MCLDLSELDTHTPPSFSNKNYLVEGREVGTPKFTPYSFGIQHAFTVKELILEVYASRNRSPGLSGSASNVINLDFDL